MKILVRAVIIYNAIKTSFHSSKLRNEFNYILEGWSNLKYILAAIAYKLA